MLSIVAVMGFAGCSPSSDGGTVKSDKTPPGAQAATPGTMSANGGGAAGPAGGGKTEKMPPKSE